MAGSLQLELFKPSQTKLRREVFVSEKPKLAEEIKKMEYEPLLPVEKRLIGWSLILGVFLFGILLWVSYRFFPGGS